MPHDQKKQGIYEIVNDATGERYIGQSTNLESRFRNHKRNLYLGRHSNPQLQRAWDQCAGRSNLRFSILEIVEDEEDLTSRERHYVEKYNSINAGYNRMMPGESPWARSNAKAQLLDTTVEEARRIKAADGKIEKIADHFGKEEKLVEWIRDGEVFSDALDMYEPENNGIQYYTGDQEFLESPVVFRYLEDQDRREFAPSFEALAKQGRGSSYGRLGEPVPC